MRIIFNKSPDYLERHEKILYNIINVLEKEVT